MKLSVELTFYPFQESYLPPIKKTIAHLKTYDGIEVKTFPTASILMGDFDTVMDVIKTTIAWSYEEFGRCVFIAKFLPGYEALR